MVWIIQFSSVLLVLLGYIIFLHLRYTKMIRSYVEQIQEEEKQFIHLEKMASLGMLSAGVAHEVNNPLMFLNTNLRLVADYITMAGIKDKDQEKEMLETLEECSDGVNRIKRIVQDLLSFSHPSQGKRQFVNINNLLDATVRILWNEIKYKVDITKDYKLVSQIWIDPNKISQVFLNLIINAVHAIKDKGTISIFTEETDKTVTVKIKDTGCGISPENLQNIFKPFYTSKGGTGLGLYVSKNIVESAGGSIKAESKVNEGTCFTIQLIKQKEEVPTLAEDKTRPDACGSSPASNT